MSEVTPSNQPANLHVFSGGTYLPAATMAMLVGSIRAGKF